MREDAFLGEYKNLGPLGKGGQSKVRKVRHLEFGYVRAICLGENGLTENDDGWKKFKERCGRLLRLCNGNHPNIVHCHQPKLYPQYGQAYFEMDFINGDNIFEYLKKNNYFLPIEEVLRMITQISDALSYCHFDTYEFCMNLDEDKDPVTGESLVKTDENDSTRLVPIDENARLKLIKKHQVIHNDISSKNIMRRNDGTFVLVDFGLSVEGNEDIDQDSIRNKAGHREYMAPERWEGGKPSPQSDIYSFGIVMYECLTGEVPFKLPSNPTTKDFDILRLNHRDKSIPNITEMRKKAYEQTFPSKEYIREKELDWLEEVILTCLGKTPCSRYKDGKALRDVVFNNLPEDSSIYKDEELKKLKKENEELISEVQSLREQLNESAKFKVCKKCGIPSFVDDGFCRNCGTKFDIQ